MFFCCCIKVNSSRKVIAKLQPLQVFCSDILLVPAEHNTNGDIWCHISLMHQTKPLKQQLIDEHIHSTFQSEWAHTLVDLHVKCAKTYLHAGVILKNFLGDTPAPLRG